MKHLKRYPKGSTVLSVTFSHQFMSAEEQRELTRKYMEKGDFSAPLKITWAWEQKHETLRVIE